MNPLETIANKQLDLLEKGGKRAVMGEKRMFGGREYIKTPDGWKFHGKGKGKKAQAHHAAHGQKKEGEKKEQSFAEKMAAATATATGNDKKEKKGANKKIAEKYKEMSAEDHETKAAFHRGTALRHKEKGEDHQAQWETEQMRAHEAEAKEKSAKKAPKGKHIGDMTASEKIDAAKELGLDLSNLRYSQLDKKLAEAKVDAEMSKFKEKMDKKGSDVTVTDLNASKNGTVYYKGEKTRAVFTSYGYMNVNFPEGSGTEDFKVIPSEAPLKDFEIKEKGGDVTMRDVLKNPKGKELVETIEEYLGDLKDNPDHKDYKAGLKDAVAELKKETGFEYDTSEVDEKAEIVRVHPIHYGDSANLDKLMGKDLTVVSKDGKNYTVKDDKGNTHELIEAEIQKIDERTLNVDPSTLSAVGIDSKKQQAIVGGRMDQMKDDPKDEFVKDLARLGTMSESQAEALYEVAQGKDLPKNLNLTMSKADYDSQVKELSSHISKELGLKSYNKDKKSPKHLGESLRMNKIKRKDSFIAPSGQDKKKIKASIDALAKDSRFSDLIVNYDSGNITIEPKKKVEKGGSQFVDSKGRGVKEGSDYSLSIGKKKASVRIKEIDDKKGVLYVDLHTQEKTRVPISTWNNKKYSGYLTPTGSLKKGNPIEVLANKHFDRIEKGGKRAVLGEIRTFAGRQHIKTATGWKYHGKGTGAKAQAHKAASGGKKEFEAAPSSFLRNHSQWNKDDYKYLGGTKGWSDKKIKERWDEEAKAGKAPGEGKNFPNAMAEALAAATGNKKGSASDSKLTAKNNIVKQTSSKNSYAVIDNKGKEITSGLSLDDAKEVIKQENSKTKGSSSKEGFSNTGVKAGTKVPKKSNVPENWSLKYRDSMGNESRIHVGKSGIFMLDEGVVSGTPHSLSNLTHSVPSSIADGTVAEVKYARNAIHESIKEANGDLSKVGSILTKKLHLGSNRFSEGKLTVESKNDKKTIAFKRGQIVDYKGHKAEIRDVKDGKIDLYYFKKRDNKGEPEGISTRVNGVEARFVSPVKDASISRSATIQGHKLKDGDTFQVGDDSSTYTFRGTQDHTFRGFKQLVADNEFNDGTTSKFRIDNMKSEGLHIHNIKRS